VNDEASEQSGAGPAPVPAQRAAGTPAGTAATGPVGEGSLIGRFVAIMTPFFAVGAGWLAGVVARAVPGVTLDKNQIVAFMVAVATSTLTASWKWLQGWQQHEQNVADGKAPPRKATPPPP
jgi:hypothetical protein